MKIYIFRRIKGWLYFFKYFFLWDRFFDFFKKNSENVPNVEIEIVERLKTMRPDLHNNKYNSNNMTDYDKNVFRNQLDLNLMKKILKPQITFATDEIWRTLDLKVKLLKVDYQYNSKSENLTRGMHIDGFFPQFKVFIYLTDVTLGSGPFTHLSENFNKTKLLYKLINFSSLNVVDFYELNEHKSKSVLGSMGTAFMMTTNIPHRGLPNIGKDRELIVCSFVIS